ncbi:MULTISPECIES: hypothetical protein [Thalassospira]|uniref:hypothetical protein n=1 Tax=Thalassospira TaxID=168934 RepID=UPI0008288CF0|nr:MULTISPECIES: hypothetical protein [Thalassospira]OCK08647.1 hypothetical protein KO164_2826 [Thalassospira sp. KO164]SEE54139.1 hypothetical protein SAMN04515623_2855 [Thalassospira permensis]
MKHKPKVLPCDVNGCMCAGTHIMVNHGRWCAKHIPPEFYRHKRIAAGLEKEFEPIGELPADQRKPKQGKLF